MTYFDYVYVLAFIMFGVAFALSPIVLTLVTGNFWYLLLFFVTIPIVVGWIMWATDSRRK